jgi:fatty acid desaturase
VSDAGAQIAGANGMDGAGTSADAEALEALRPEVLARFGRTPDRAYGLRHLGAAWGQLALLIVLLPHGPEGVAWTALAFAAMGWTQYRQYFVLHEACHQTLLPHPGANRWAGRITAGILFTSYASFTAVHMEHHRLWGKPEDPGAVDYFVRFRSRGELLRFFLKPLCGLAVVEKLWTNVVSPLWRRGAGGARPGQPSVEPIDVACVLGVQALIFLGTSGLGAHPFDYALLYVLPEITIFLFLARLRMYLEHGPVDYAVSDYLGANRRRIARSHASNPLEGPLFNYMNFRFHREHHLFPALPSVHLPEIHRRFTRARLDPDDFSESYLASLGRILRLPESGSPSGPARRP